MRRAFSGWLSIAMAGVASGALIWLLAGPESSLDRHSDRAEGAARVGLADKTDLPFEAGALPGQHTQEGKGERSALAAGTGKSAGSNHAYEDERPLSERPARRAEEIILLVAPEAEDGVGEFQELTLKQVRETIRMTENDLAVSAAEIEAMEDKLLEAGGEIVDGVPYFEGSEDLPGPLRDFVENLRMSLEGEHQREAWRREKLERYRYALQTSGFAER